MITVIVSLITALAPIAAILLGFLKANSAAAQQAVGARSAAGVVSQASAATQAAVAQAEAAAPATQAELDARLKAGTF